MKRQSHAPQLLASLAIVVASLFGASSRLSAQDKAPVIAELDPEMAERKVAADGLAWYDVTTWGAEGRILPDANRQRWFDRFPASAKGSVTKNVWNLSRDSAGMMVRFKTDATAIHLHYKLMDTGLAMPTMPATGVSGVDLYARDGEGQWRWVQVTKPSKQEMKVQLAGGLKPGFREYAAYLPLYNGVEFMSIGVTLKSKFVRMAPREKPIVFYGTSITHGACASRPGMVHTAILGRRFDRPVVNLGFSGNGRMDQAVGEFLVQVDASVYVIDCLPNMNADAVSKKCVPLVKQIRAAKPQTPVVLVEDRRNTNSWITPSRDAHHTANHKALRDAFAQLQAAGIEHLYYISGDELYGTDGEGATDGSHASDLGFMRQADVFEPVLREAMSKH
ncbi:MAG: SGNH/GDSL hydrolase family protein [Aureliella sp.]